MIGGVAYDVYLRNVLDCIRALWRDAEFSPVLMFEPERHYLDENKDVRLFHDMNTGDWWWGVQVWIEPLNFEGI